MCNLFGFVNFGTPSERKLMAYVGRNRGTEGCGFAWVTPGAKENTYRVTGKKYVEDIHRPIIENTTEIHWEAPLFLGHARRASPGLSPYLGGQAQQNSHPFRSNEIMLAHNGYVRNWRKLKVDHCSVSAPTFVDVDSHMLAILVDMFGYEKAFAMVDGPAACWWINTKDKKPGFHLWCWHQDLHIWRGKGQFAFSSERAPLTMLGIPDKEVERLDPDAGRVLTVLEDGTVIEEGAVLANDNVAKEKAAAIKESTSLFGYGEWDKFKPKRTHEQGEEKASVAGETKPTNMATTNQFHLTKRELKAMKRRAKELKRSGGDSRIEAMARFFTLPGVPWMRGCPTCFTLLTELQADCPACEKPAPRDYFAVPMFRICLDCSTLLKVNCGEFCPHCKGQPSRTLNIGDSEDRLMAHVLYCHYLTDAGFALHISFIKDPEIVRQIHDHINHTPLEDVAALLSIPTYIRPDDVDNVDAGEIEDAQDAQTERPSFDPDKPETFDHLNTIMAEADARRFAELQAKHGDA